MSISGMSDFQDFCEIHYTPEEIIENFQIYRSVNDIIPLKIQSKKDLVAFYPFPVAILSSDKENGHIYLADKSYIDIEEIQKISWCLHNVIKYYKKCKRKKILFDKNAALEKMVLFEPPEPFQIELIDRVAEFGEKAKIDGLHDSSHDTKRNRWYDLMINNGWDMAVAYKWVYGNDRFFDKLKSEDKL